MQRRHDEEPIYSVAQKGPVAPRRREEEEEGKIVPGWWPNGWEPKPPLPPPTKKCRCPSCNFEMVIEEGARCLNSVCPRCGHRMAEI